MTPNPRPLAAACLAAVLTIGAAVGVVLGAAPPDQMIVAGAAAGPPVVLAATVGPDLQPPHVATTTTVPPTTTTTAPPPPPTTTAPPPPPPVKKVVVTAQTTSSYSGGGSGDPNDMASWDRLAQCESGGNWSINTGNGYYGGIQFSLSSWRAVGGTGYPHEHSRAEQIRRGQMLYAQGGWGHWPGCTRSFGWR